MGRIGRKNKGDLGSHLYDLVKVGEMCLALKDF